MARTSLYTVDDDTPAIEAIFTAAKEARTTVHRVSPSRRRNHTIIVLRDEEGYMHRLLLRDDQAALAAGLLGRERH